MGDRTKHFALKESRLVANLLRYTNLPANVFARPPKVKAPKPGRKAWN